MPYIIYKDSIEPPLDGKTFFGIALLENYAPDKIAIILVVNGFKGSFPNEPASFELPILNDGVSYNLGIAECDLIITGDAKYAELSRSYEKTESGFEITINYDDKPLPLEGTIDVYEIPKITVLKRLDAAGKFNAVMDVIEGDRWALQQWNAVDVVHSNDPVMLSMFTALSVDASVILSPVGVEP